jgi:hypothetical protein
MSRKEIHLLPNKFWRINHGSHEIHIMKKIPNRDKTMRSLNKRQSSPLNFGTALFFVEALQEIGKLFLLLVGRSFAMGLS